MEKTTQTFEVTVEKSETFVIRRYRENVSNWCDICRCEVEMSEPESAARIMGVKPRAIYKKIEAGEIHFIEPSGGLLIVCLDSLNRCLGSRI